METGNNYQKHDFPANVPLKLIKAFREENENQRALARRLGVNPGHVSKLLLHGVEPVDPAIREKMFLPKKVRPPLEAWVREATNNLAELQKNARPLPNRTYNRKGKRVT